jgi:hypothetical protein
MGRQPKKLIYEHIINNITPREQRPSRRKDETTIKKTRNLYYNSKKDITSGTKEHPEQNLGPNSRQRNNKHSRRRSNVRLVLRGKLRVRDGVLRRKPRAKDSASRRKPSVRNFVLSKGLNDRQVSRKERPCSAKSERYVVLQKQRQLAIYYDKRLQSIDEIPMFARIWWLKSDSVEPPTTTMPNDQTCGFGCWDVRSQMLSLGKHMFRWSTLTKL